MKSAIVGLKYTGKSTIFNILTRGQGPAQPSGRQEVVQGVAPIPDPRLDRLAALYQPHKTTPATAQYVDLPGVEADELKESAFLGSLRPAEALVHVVRAFDSPVVPHPLGSVDPARDALNMEHELIFADLFQAEKRLERLEKDLKKIKNKELEAEHALLVRLRGHLEEERPLRELTLAAEDERLVRGFTFLSQKPLLVVANLDEADVAHLGDVAAHCGLGDWGGRPAVVVTGVCGKIEAELAGLAPEEAREFMAELGIAEPGTARLLRENYRLLGLISFFTVGKDEVRAWTIPQGLNAQRAAGVIHTDLEKGFIRAEVCRQEDLVALGSMPAVREKGLLRLEGKEYIVADGDVFHVRFNI